METVLMAVHLVACLALIGIVLVQRSESSGGLGIGGGNMGGLMSARGTANFLTKTTAILATVVMLTAIGMAVLHKGTAKPKSVIDTLVEQTQQTPPKSVPAKSVAPDAQATPVAPEPAKPTEPAKPSVPMAQ